MTERDQAPEIAQAICEDESLDWRDLPAVRDAICRRWPGADSTTLRRAFEIAVELTLCDPPEGEEGDAP